MPDEDDVTRIGRGPAYGWGPIDQPDPPAAIASPGQVRTSPDRRGLIAGLAALGVTVLIGAVAAGAYLLGHRSPGPRAQTVNVPAAATSSSPTGKIMLGKLTMPHYGTPHLAGDTPNWKVTKLGCEGQGGYSDIDVGASVTIYDGSGTIVGSSSLLFGTRHGESCDWPFSADNLPDVPFYQVEVSHRGKVTVAREDLGNVALTLGD